MPVVAQRERSKAGPSATPLVSQLLDGLDVLGDRLEFFRIFSGMQSLGNGLRLMTRKAAYRRELTGTMSPMLGVALSSSGLLNNSVRSAAATLGQR